MSSASSLGVLRQFDFFLTDAEYDKDETEIGTVTTGDTLTSTLTLGDSDYGLKVGDLVRIGNSATESSDILVVLEILSATTVRVNYQVKHGLLPLYKIRSWLADGIKLDTTIRAIKAVEVKGYALVGIAGGGLTDAFEKHHDDYYGLFFDELPGSTYSPNRWLNGALAVIPGHTIGAIHPQSWQDERNVMNYTANGFGYIEFDTQPPRITKLTPRLKDRKGNPAPISRFHLWLRVWAYAT